MEYRILKVNLSNRSYEIDVIPEKAIKNFVGGRGLGAYLLCTLVAPRIDPLSEKNHLIFTAGPASGTNLPYSSKSVVNTKSPLTNIYLFSVSSGTLSHQIKKAGFWAVDITGTADSPTYLEINNQKVEFKDASKLWGMEVNEAQQAMLKAFGKKAAAASIGPAGEKLVKYASIFSDGLLYRAFGRGGSGCVMGSKKLKGMLVYGDGEASIGDTTAFDRVKKSLIEKVKANTKWSEARHLYGSNADTAVLNGAAILPTRNWRSGQFDGIDGVSPQKIQDWPLKPVPCGPYCLTPCSRYYEVKEGPYRGARCDGPEYETFYSLGSNCGISQPGAIVAAEQICDEYGIDTMTAGVAIGFAMECFEKGLIGLKDTDGIELRFGNEEAMLTMLKKTVNQEGFGRRLAEGVKRLSAQIPGSEGFAMHAKGLELGGYECRGLMGQALQFAIDNRGGCHHAYGLTARVEGFDGTRLETKGKGQTVKNAAIRRIVSDCLPVCTFAATIYDNATVAEAASALIGESRSVGDLSQVGARIMCQERLFNMREGIARKDDSLPLRLLKEPLADGPTKGAVVPLEELKDDYYRAMGWDLATGNPSDALLASLEIKK